MNNRDLCVRCGKPTIYEASTPVTLRRYFVEGSGQLCEECFYSLYPVPTVYGSKLGADNAPNQELEKDYSK